MKTYLTTLALFVFAMCANTRAADAGLEWDANPAASGYRVYYGTAEGVYTMRYDAGAAATTATITGLLAGQTYYFAATAYDTEGLESAFSNEIVRTVPVTNPLPPVLSYDSATRNLQWANPLAPPTPLLANYVLERAVGAQGSFSQIATVTGTASYRIPVGTPAGTYRYRVATVVDGKAGAWSNAVSVMLVAPLPPTRLRLRVEISTGLNEWKTEWEGDIEEEQRLFARLVMVRP